MEVRRFVEADRPQMADLFVRAAEGSPSGNFWGHPPSEAAIYLDPYMDLEPESLFVAVDPDGALVGYLAGCVDSAQFVSETARFDAAIKEHRLMFKLGPLAFFARAARDVIGAKIRRQPVAQQPFEDDDEHRRWPAHLHINLVPAARSTGAAYELMDRWLGKLRDAGSSGCHLGTLVENTRAVQFFERCGFTKHGPTPLVPGLRHRGKRLHQQTMVWGPNNEHGSDNRS